MCVAGNTIRHYIYVFIIIIFRPIEVIALNGHIFTTIKIVKKQYFTRFLNYFRFLVAY